MNIFLIGNGFDLAHGLPTQYKDFLDWIIGEYEFYYDLKKQGQSVLCLKLCLAACPIPILFRIYVLRNSLRKQRRHFVTGFTAGDGVPSFCFLPMNQTCDQVSQK